MILVPMHTKFVEPTKEFADLVVDVLKNGIDESYKILLDKLVENKLI